MHTCAGCVHTARALPHLRACLAGAGPLSFRTPSPDPGASGLVCCSQDAQGVLGMLPRPRLGSPGSWGLFCHPSFTDDDARPCGHTHHPPWHTSPAWEAPQGCGECLGLGVRFSLGWSPGSHISGFGPGPCPLWASVSSFIKWWRGVTHLKGDWKEQKQGSRGGPGATAPYHGLLDTLL